MKYGRCFRLIAVVMVHCALGIGQSSDDIHQQYEGAYFSGTGDTEYLSLLDSAYGMMQPNPWGENLSMLYTTDWNGFVEGPTWDAWWIQNSFGPTYTMLPFLNKAYQTFVRNAQALWFDHMGNGVRAGKLGFVAPVGALCDCASPTLVVYRQGDGKVNLHDWAFGFTAAGIILQSELLLISRDMEDIKYYVPLLEKSADFIDTRLNPVNHMFLVGPAAIILEPSFAGTGILSKDGSYGKAYLAEISINYIAALDRLIELEKMMKRYEKAQSYSNRIKLIKKGLAQFVTDKGYFVRSIDPDGTKHGVYGAPVHGYFASSANCDAIAFRIADDQQALKIYDMIKSVPQLRPYKLMIPNYPAYDDMYEYDGLFQYGTWVNGGEWATQEARVQMAYYRVGAYQDAAASFHQILSRSHRFRLDNPLTQFGAVEYQPNLPVNCVYDCWGVPGGFLRGLFEYVYTAQGLWLYPHIPSSIHALNQKFPVYFGKKEIYISVNGHGNLTAVELNGEAVKDFTKKSVFLPLDASPGKLYVSLGLGGSRAKPINMLSTPPNRPAAISLGKAPDYWDIDLLCDPTDTAIGVTKPAVLKNIRKMASFYKALLKQGRENSYEAQHAALILQMVAAIHERRTLRGLGRLNPLSEPAQSAADHLFIGTVRNLTQGLVRHLEQCGHSSDQGKRNMYLTWANI